MDNNKIQYKTHFVKTNDFKTSNVNGIFGGLTHNGQITMHHFIERNVLPKEITYEIDKNLDVQTPIEVSREQKDGLIREVQGALLMDIDMAKSIIVWLQSKIQEFETSNKR